MWCRPRREAGLNTRIAARASPPPAGARPAGAVLEPSHKGGPGEEPDPTPGCGPGARHARQLVPLNPGRPSGKNAIIISAADDYRAAVMAPLLPRSDVTTRAVKCATGQSIRLPGTRLPVNAVSPRPPQAQRPPRRSRQVRGTGRFSRRVGRAHLAGSPIAIPARS